ncbi:MAG: DUF438 domain-containing protein [Candidatus Hodarchaeota archaeon]
MANAYQNAKTWALAGLLKRINLGEDLKLLRNEAGQLAKSIDPSDIAGAEQTLINEGYSSRVVKQLSATFILMGLHKRRQNNLEDKLPDDHILLKMMAEHDLVRCYLADLNNAAETIRCLNYLTDVSSEFRNLCHIIKHLSIVTEHIDREEYIIFPFLMKLGWAGLCQTAQTEHAIIRINIDSLVELVTSFNKIRLEDFKSWFITIVQNLSSIMLEHLSYEDDLLWPVSLVVIVDAEDWKSMKALCDEIGY